MNNVYIQGAVIAVIGLSTVFVVLALLWGVLEVMRLCFTPKTAKKEEPKKAPAPAPAPVAQAPSPAAEDEGELVAVLAAAVAAFLDKPQSALRIASYRRVENQSPIWNRTARRDNILG